MKHVNDTKARTAYNVISRMITKSGEIWLGPDALDKYPKSGWSSGQTPGHHV